MYHDGRMSFGFAPPPASSYDGLSVALYGGSFNPPHIGHQFAIIYALAVADPGFDRLWIMPTWKHPFDKALVPFEDRVAMCFDMARPFGGRVEVSRIEEELGLQKGAPSYTINTIEELRARHPTTKFTMVIGADLVTERERWHRWPELAPMLDFFVVGRAGTDTKFDDRPEIPSITSTEIRARVHNGLDCSRWMDARVWRYIKARGLYRPRSGE